MLVSDMVADDDEVACVLELGTGVEGKLELTDDEVKLVDVVDASTAVFPLEAVLLWDEKDVPLDCVTDDNVFGVVVGADGNADDPELEVELRDIVPIAASDELEIMLLEELSETLESVETLLLAEELLIVVWAMDELTVDRVLVGMPTVLDIVL